MATPRLKDTIAVERVSGIDASGELVFLPTFQVKGAVWRRRLKAVVAAGEQFDITAQGFLATVTTTGSGFVPQLRDRLTVSAHGVQQRYEVRNRIEGVTERNRLDHWGVELSEAAT